MVHIWGNWLSIRTTIIQGEKLDLFPQFEFIWLFILRKIFLITILNLYRNLLRTPFIQTTKILRKILHSEYHTCAKPLSLYRQYEEYAEIGH